MPVGQIALHAMLESRLPPPPTRSFTHHGARRTIEERTDTEELYPPAYQTDGTLLENLRFALKYEPLDLRVIHATLIAIGPAALEAWVRAEPTGAFSRRAWFYYETLTGQALDLEPARIGNYVDALDSKRHYVADPRNSSRHRVRDNLLGNGDLCPVIRRTRRLEAMVGARIDEAARNLTGSYAPEMLARVVSFLYTKETRASFALEGETPSPQREQRFLQALHEADAFEPLDKNALVRLQATVVDPRYAAQDWRDFQNFVGETSQDYREVLHFICPRPEDVPRLMQGWGMMTERVLTSRLDAVLAAAVSSFAFVFIHPFEDGNGRIHRFLIHSALTKLGFVPPGVLFPVSAAILRHKTLYDAALEAFSQPLMSAIDWNFTRTGEIAVRNDTRDLYRFFDATVQAEYLYERVAETVQVDLKEELDFLQTYDAALAAVRVIVDMPDRRASLLVRLCLQNKGRLSQTKRPQFAELTDHEIAQIEAALAQIS